MEGVKFTFGKSKQFKAEEMAQEIIPESPKPILLNNKPPAYVDTLIEEIDTESDISDDPIEPMIQMAPVPMPQVAAPAPMPQVVPVAMPQVTVPAEEQKEEPLSRKHHGFSRPSGFPGTTGAVEQSGQTMVQKAVIVGLAGLILGSFFM
jgi:hypothetical protein